MLQILRRDLKFIFLKLYSNQLCQYKLDRCKNLNQNCSRFCNYAITSVRWTTVVRVTFFRQKNYFAEYETRRNRREFRRNSACFAEGKKLRNFVTNNFLEEKNPWNSVPNHFRMIKPWNSFPNHFQKRKLRNSVPYDFRMKKKIGIPFRTIFGRENT
jgi:hypothetical protein